MDSQNTKNRPKYEMIKEALLERIHTGDFSFDEAFCTEKMLSEQYEVSRRRFGTAGHSVPETRCRKFCFAESSVG